MLTKLLLALCLLATPCGMADVTVVVGQPPAVASAAPVVTNAWIGNTTGTSVGVTVSSTAGRLLVVYMGAYKDTSTHANHAVTDNLGSTYTKITGINGTICAASIWYLKNCPSGITSITVNGGTGTSYLTGIVHQCSGASTSAPFTSGEYVEANRVATTNPQTPSLTCGTANSIVFAGFVNNTAAPSLNGTGTIGTWAHYSAASHQDTGSYEAISVPNIIVASGSTVHGWTTGNTTSLVLAAAFHP